MASTARLLALGSALCLLISFLAAPAASEAVAPCALACHGSCGAAAQKARAAGGMRPHARRAAAASSMAALIDRAVASAEVKAAAAARGLTTQQFPAATTPGGAWELRAAGHWMSGFFSGVMWQLHALTGKQAWADKAALWQAPLAERQRDWAAQHDFGFIYLPSFAHSYGVTRSPEDRRQALAAAEATAWAFNPATRSLRTFEGWRPPGATQHYQQLVIIDFMVNIHILVWGAQNVGPPSECSAWRMEPDPATSWMAIAKQHARAVANNHVRPDGSTCHIVEYNPESGEVNKRFTYQGHADNSTWARGQAWAMYGFSKLAADTGEEEFLVVARRVSDAWLVRLGRQQAAAAAAQRQQQAAAGGGAGSSGGGSGAGGSDGSDGSSSSSSSSSSSTAGIAPELDVFVPVWDFDAPFLAELDGPRDSSAAAVAALGLLHLAEAEAAAAAAAANTSSTDISSSSGSSCGGRYLAAAVRTLAALGSPKYLSPAEETAAFPALLRHATGGFPLRSHVDVGLISGDYFFLAALAKCAGMPACVNASAGAA